jgi:asparagine N-glycosylation enzyme membrane subunit Stt3
MPAAPSLEQVIAPLPSPLNQDRVVASIQKQPPELAILRWGQAGSLPVPTEITGQGVSFTVNDPFNQNYTEQSRQTSNVQITAASDPSTYVTVQRINAITFTIPAAEAGPSLSYTGFPVSSGGSTSGSTVQQTSIPAGGVVSSTFNLDNASYDDTGGS